jgi:hypothetical protein
MNRPRFALVAIALWIFTPSLLFAMWSLGSPPDNAELSKTAKVASAGMTDEPNTMFKVYFQSGGVKYDVETGTSPAMGAMWSHTHMATLQAPHDCPVMDNILFVLEVDGAMTANNDDIDMNP